MTADDPILTKPASEYTPEERRKLIHEARLYMFEVQKRMERLAELEEMIAEAAAYDEPPKST